MFLLIPRFLPHFFPFFFLLGDRQSRHIVFCLCFACSNAKNVMSRLSSTQKDTTCVAQWRMGRNTNTEVLCIRQNRFPVSLHQMQKDSPKKPVSTVCPCYITRHYKLTDKTVTQMTPIFTHLYTSPCIFYSSFPATKGVIALLPNKPRPLKSIWKKRFKRWHWWGIFKRTSWTLDFDFCLTFVAHLVLLERMCEQALSVCPSIWMRTPLWQTN